MQKRNEPAGNAHLYFKQLDPAGTRQLMADLAGLAAEHGYLVTGAGASKGRGNVAELLEAIASGEVALVLLPDEQRDQCIEWLRRANADPAAPDGICDIIAALEQAREREND